MFTCPKCGGLMVPKRREDGKIVLSCLKCGYEMEPTPEMLKKLRIVVKPDKKAKVKTTSKPSEAPRVRVSTEELEQAKEEYYELVLEQMGDYGE